MVYLPGHGNYAGLGQRQPTSGAQRVVRSCGAVHASRNAGCHTIKGQDLRGVPTNNSGTELQQLPADLVEAVETGALVPQMTRNSRNPIITHVTCCISNDGSAINPSSAINPTP